MNNNLSKCKPGDWIATIQHGWLQIKRVEVEVLYSIITDRDSYTLSGRDYSEDKAPSAFVDPPEWLLEYIGPKPCEFKKDDLVIVDNTCLRYFSHYEDGKYYTYCGGQTSITTQETIAWDSCRKAIKGEDY